MFGPSNPQALRIARWFFFLGVLLIAQTTWRPALAFTLSDWIFLAAVLCALPLMVQGKMEVPIPKIMLVGLGFILLGGLLSTPSAQWPLSSLFSLLKLFYLIVIWFSVGTFLLRRSEDVQKAMMLWSISVGVTSAAAGAQLIWGDIIPGTSPVWGRMTGFAEHVNDLGGVTSIALVPALYLATVDRYGPWLKWISWFVACLILAGLVWSGSLSGILAASTGLFLWIILHKGGWKEVLVLFIGGGAIVVLAHMIPPVIPEEPKPMVAKIESTPITQGGIEEPKVRESLTESVKTEEAKTESEKKEPKESETVLTQKEEDDKALEELSKTYRVQRDEPPLLVVRMLQLKEKTLDFQTLKLRILYFKKTWDTITQNIFVGVGVGHWNGSYETGELVHNFLLGSFFEGGLFALIGVLILLWAIAKIGIDVIKSPDRQIQLMGMALFCAFCSFVVLGMAQPIYYKRFQWLPVLFLLCLYSRQKPSDKLVN